MSNDLEKLTGAGGALELGGKTLLLRRLTLGDYGQIKVWLKDKMPKPFTVAADALLELQPLKTIDPEAFEASRREIIIRAQNATEKASSGESGDIADLMNSPDGISFLLWLSARGNHPDLELKWVKEAVDGEELLNIVNKLDDINLMGDDENGDLMSELQLAAGGTPEGIDAAKKNRAARRAARAEARKKAKKK